MTCWCHISQRRGKRDFCLFICHHCEPDVHFRDFVWEKGCYYARAISLGLCKIN